MNDDALNESLEDTATAQCPYCGEQVELELDPLGPHEEQYVEDCSVCCRPWNVHVKRAPEGGGVELWLERDDD